MDNSVPFATFPATRHQNAYGLNFADGQLEIYHLRTPVTQIPEPGPAHAVVLLGIPPTNTGLDQNKKQVTSSPNLFVAI